MKTRFLLVGDQALSVQFGDQIKVAANLKVKTLQYDLARHPIAGVGETVPTYIALTIHYRPDVIGYEELLSQLEERIAQLDQITMPAQTVTEIPVLYGGEKGMDLEACAAFEEMTIETFIQTHSQSEYYIYMLGFAPGHPYTARFENPFHFQRRSSPRVKVSGNSIVAQTNLTNILPFDQPCGWNVIGATPIRICNYRKTNPFLLQAGHWVKYFPVTAAEYARIEMLDGKGSYQCKVYEKVVSEWQ